MISGDVYSICSAPSSSADFASSGWITSPEFGDKLYENSVTCTANLPHGDSDYIIMSISAKVLFRACCVAVLFGVGKAIYLLYD